MWKANGNTLNSRAKQSLTGLKTNGSQLATDCSKKSILASGFCSSVAILASKNM